MIAEARSHVEHRGRSRQSAPADSCHRVHRTICWILRLYRGIIRRLSCLIGPCSGHRAHSIYHRATAISFCLSSRSAPVWSSMSCEKQAWISSSLNFRSPSQHSSSRSNTKSTQSQTADSLSVLPTLDKPFRQSSGKIRPLRKKSGPQLNLTFWRHLGRWKFCYLCLYAWKKYNISLICCTELERISGKKQSFKKFGHFSALSVQNRPVGNIAHYD